MFSEIAVENGFLLNKGFIDPNHLQNAKIIEHNATNFVITNPQDVKLLIDEFRSMGEYDEIFDVSDLTQGIYIIQIQAQGKKVSRKLVIQ